ncbi:methyltransferase domain-containing protein [Bradyrhizobium sp. U87765 SZCCT0131]|uniref:class I SAM-dependent methyltransferase n=1 Tax=unclassified Bradyrhizobium TaxID=2631580 RepID=UPI001BA8E078|nr:MULTISPECIES: methyltransferase domain-containing protein [unclassified Bradyrhizobium]MBR1223143.1 methyltransferase domain-containing protein [Bradyrhizobium sp. U87765 SZCCT0131]MBR1265721.1 methyltransferase domain-containing protein [Bradyrhizobium sp. U87765 SZCCT0134]MBR1309308.1 methyltransferase domain-containing protein [Bradyrhizobium sp. U87765 SZCCT0110]MBR1324136.1 methyltransferase domain-containing protein [Bradyrhizobium sp. U87765 SZCCT0109]MBR1352569.1 methyltransferase d
MPTSDEFRFLKAWLGAPLRTASVTPSSRHLAALITRGIGPRTGPVLELGPGTGVFTSALLMRGVAERDITLVEACNDFIPHLAARFPNARVLHMDARGVGEALRDDAEPLGAVVSGLPLLSMPPWVVVAILRACFARLRPGGAFYQFTYTARCPVHPVLLRRVGLTAEKVGTTLRNIPPASVYRLSRIGPH